MLLWELRKAQWLEILRKALLACIADLALYTRQTLFKRITKNGDNVNDEDESDKDGDDKEVDDDKGRVWILWRNTIIAMISIMVAGMTMRMKMPMAIKMTLMITVFNKVGGLQT